MKYTVMAQAVATFRESGTVDEVCFEKIRKDVKRCTPHWRLGTYRHSTDRRTAST
ncbi:hypothetical protein [Dehalobacterium formicoaceticum]|uniref:Uncharacterized protein n=1 Tax=Dehalobacterium formicoaceticum TaxID=51515 RepID=A0ABT1Y284_9FIRM|nr:hypothetical protein [Dehalobacterium formicoaceticum]MCR6544978.1 hypothetical protein [Dehalobacterium formicoaceticum]